MRYHSAVLNTDPLPTTTRFVGRQWELAILQRELDAALSGQLRVAVLAGEPGIGKTRLMAELTQRVPEQARSGGAIVLKGGASDAEGMPPYLPVLEALGTYIQAADETLLQEQCGDSAAILATILPEITLRLGPVVSPYALPQEQGRLRLFEAVGALLHAIAERSGLLLVLDDLHWADPSTLDLLVHLARRQTAARLLVIAGYRPLEADAHVSLRRSLAEMARQRVLTTLSLGPLTRRELHDLLGDVDDSVIEALYARSGGNAFFAEELLRSWLDSGALAKGAGRWNLLSDTHLDLPESIVAAVDMRLARLPASTQDLIRIAAVIGRSFDLDLLAHVVGRAAEQAEDDLAHAVSAGLLRHEESAYRFVHDTVREAAGSGMGAVRRRRIHTVIAEALENLSNAGARYPLGAGTAELAFHFCRAGNGEKGVRYALLAAEEAEERYAFAEAFSLYREALDLLQAPRARPGGGDSDLYGAVVLHCARAALNAGHEREAHELFQQVYGWYERVSDAQQAGRAAHGMASARWRQGDLHGASVALDIALSKLMPYGGADVARVLVDMASVRNWLGRQPEGLEAAQQALALAAEMGDRRLEAAACRVAGQLTAWGNDLEGGNRLLERALVLAIESDDPGEAAEVCGVLANTSFATFDSARSGQVTLMRMEFARRSQQPHEMRHVHGWLAELCVFRGEWAEAEELLAQAQVVVEELEDEEPRAALSRVRGLMAEYRGQLEESSRWYADALARVQSKGPQHLCWYVGPLARVELVLGNRTRSHELILQLEDAIGQIPEGVLPAAPGLTDLVEWELGEGDLHRARAHAQRLKRFQGRMFLSAVDLTLARYEHALGNRAAARTYIERADRDVRRAQLRPHLLATLLEKVKLIEPHERAAALQEAADLCELMGLHSRAEQIKKELEPREPHRLPAGLSARELEVLRLVAAGHSNREIARLLILSDKTVEHHLTSIFNKTGTVNRAAATAFALRHGLA